MHTYLKKISVYLTLAFSDDYLLPGQIIFLSFNFSVKNIECEGLMDSYHICFPQLGLFVTRRAHAIHQ